MLPGAITLMFYVLPLGWAISKTAVLDHYAQPGQNEVTVATLVSCCIHTLPPATEVR